ncbi:MAG: short-chain fatty acyl-CoA regulator family protein [Deltaproteobacteria bacterium]|nr:short-chain fatty acyl-CoA regulator family protein [Deltaproteobacteria bacterium]
MSKIKGEKEAPKLGAKVKSLRRAKSLSQQQLAERLGISASYLNLIENNRRPLPAALMIALSQVLSVELSSFVSDDNARLSADLLEALSDPLFDAHALHGADVRELVNAMPNLAHALLHLYRAHQDLRERDARMAAQLSDGERDLRGITHAPSEEVNDMLQRQGNHFAPLERAAEALWTRGKLDADDLYGSLKNLLEREHGVRVLVLRRSEAGGIQRRFDPERRTLALSELLPTRSRSFQLAHQLALLSLDAALDALIDDDGLSSPESRSLARVTLANYFAGAVLMPYQRFLDAAREERYDVDVLGRRFRVGFEQVAHRLTTLRRPGNEGVPFHFLRIDVAGNISKRFSGSGIRFARFSGACPRWNVFAAFQTPGMIRIQLSRMPEGHTFFCIARTIQKDAGGYHSQQPVMAIGLGCDARFARELVYSDGVDLERAETAIAVGVTCRLCERTDCDQRAVPSLRAPLRINENLRGASPYSVSLALE